MELPRLIVVGEKNIDQIGRFLQSLDNPKKVSIIAGQHIQKIVKKKFQTSLAKSKIHTVWHVPQGNDEKSIRQVQNEIEKDKADLLVGIGGGRSVDVAKMIAFNLQTPFVSVPTAASHDGIASPFVSVRGEKPHSVVATAPLGVFVDIDIIKKAPRKLLASGCGDLVAKITAVKDWEIGREKTGEYFGRYSSNLASMSAKILIEASEKKKLPDIREIVEALISAGVASCIAGSSRPCSGSEHLFSHALDKIAPEIGLHGEKCGIGAILMAKLQGQDWKKIVNTLKNVGAPTTAKEIGLKQNTLVKALIIAQSLRPERYTILKEIKMTEKRALDLAKSTGVL
jgi:glycerol-1-phosphate dehydrogenase [NAD(P)+]